jgi:hypothetical protein
VNSRVVTPSSGRYQNHNRDVLSIAGNTIPFARIGWLINGAFAAEHMATIPVAFKKFVIDGNFPVT